MHALYNLQLINYMDLKESHAINAIISTTLHGYTYFITELKYTTYQLHCIIIKLPSKSKSKRV
jgi:hypothetical protein